MTIQKRITRWHAYLLDRPQVQKIIGNSGWLLAYNITRLILTILVGAWVARYLGVQRFGQLSLVIAYVSLIAPIARLGLDTVIVRRVVEESERTGIILGTAFYLKLSAWLILLPCLFIAIQLLHPQQPILWLFTIMIGVGSTFFSADVIVFWLYAKEEARYISIVRSATLLVLAGGKVIAILASASILMIVALYAVDAILYAALLGVMYLAVRNKIDTQTGNQRWTVQWAYARSLLAESWPLIFAGLAISVYMRIDQIMLGQLLPIRESEQAIGIYAVAVRISEMWYFVPEALITSLVPTVLLSKKESASLYHKRLQRMFSLVVLVSYVFAVLLTVSAHFIINVIYGADYAQVAPVLIVLVWSGVWVSLGIARAPILLAEDANVFTMWSTVLGAITNIVLNLILIPSMGVMGCAIATLIAQIVSGHLTSFLFPRTLVFARMQTRALLYPNPFSSKALNERYR